MSERDRERVIFVSEGERVKKKTSSTTEMVNKILFDAEEEIKEIEKCSFFSNRLINDNFEIAYEMFKNRVISIYPFIKSDFKIVENLAKEAVYNGDSNWINILYYKKNLEINLFCSIKEIVFLFFNLFLQKF